jgi:hypothetical protein
MELGEVLSKAWKIIWKNKVLWIFGILASCGQSGGGGGGSTGRAGNFNMPNNNNFNFQNGENPFANGNFPQLDELGRKMGQFLGNGDQVPWAIITGLICLVLFIVLVCVFLGTIGRIGLIRGTVMAEGGQEPLTFGQIWSASMPYFWKIFLLNLFAGLVIFIAILVLMLPLILLTVFTLGIGVMCLIPFICLLVPIGWILNVILEQANVALIVENLGIVDAIRRGWRVCRLNIGPMAVVALVVIFGGGIVSLIISLPMILVLLPVIFTAMSNDQAALTAGLGTAAVLLCCTLPFVIAIQGILQSYIGSIWTLTFMRLTAPKPDLPEIQPPEPLIN